MSAAKTSISNIEFYPIGNDSFIGIASASHNLKDNDIINLSGISTTSARLAGDYQVGLPQTL